VAREANADFIAVNTIGHVFDLHESRETPATLT
jgi:hypothetical protein